MNTIVLLIDREDAWSPETWAKAAGGKLVGDRQITIDQESDWLSIVRDDQVLNDFDEEERDRLGELVGEPIVYLIEWKGGELVEHLLRSIPPATRAAVDNDHGLLVLVHQLVGKLIGSWIKATSLLL
ncbi:MAG: hypothetical protein JNN30_00670 [Rhodanobacteraceae bacterium]|nr:hypothetical protein [Rhodanobacteraceae bacterium]